MSTKLIRSTLVVPTLCICLAAALYAQDASSGNSRPPVLQTPHPRYQLRAGDTLEVNFRFTPEFNQTVAVQPDGYISLRDLSDIYVAGKTSPELVWIIMNAYSKTLHEPVVTVSIKDFEKPYFIAGGEVGRPGKYEMRGPVTVVEAISIAGGFNENSKHSQVLLFRPVSDKLAEARVLDIKKMLASRNLKEDLSLHPGDVLYVPKNTVSKIKRFVPIPTLGLTPNI